MIDTEILKQVKEISLPVILASFGIRPVSPKDPYSGHHKYVYLASYRDEMNPSLSVFQSRQGQWLYRDHTTGETGTNLDLMVRFGWFRDLSLIHI